MSGNSCEGGDEGEGREETRKEGAREWIEGRETGRIDKRQKKGMNGKSKGIGVNIERGG